MHLLGDDKSQKAGNRVSAGFGSRRTSGVERDVEP